MKRMAVLGSLGVIALVALSPVLSCSSSGGGSEPAAFTESDRAEIVDQLTAATTSISLAIAGSLVFLPAPPTETKSKSVLTPKSAGTLSCTTAGSGSTCSCTYSGEIVQCHVTVDEQDLCDVSGSRWLKGRADATGTPAGANASGDFTLTLGPPPCVVSADGLTLDGTLATTVSAQSTGEVFHMLFRMFSNGITATRGGKEVGVCLVDITITESGASGTICGNAFPPAMPPTTPRHHIF
ncbi:MAG TPA: hypothetical protein VLT33_37525 [Labilithrix sp.]|nr:hypothetical protein [Labilithrix sp.]